jgi:hypothetical protein
MKSPDILSLPSFRCENAITKRYYKIILSYDLLGDWVVTCVWGGISKATGRIRHLPCSSYEEGIALVTKITKIRLKRGYIICNSINNMTR